jgi:hypothetical protein
LDTSALVAYRNAERDLMGTLAEINRVFDVKVGDLGQLQKQLASDSAKCSAALLDFPRPGGKS